jgi:type 1 glutamine amidotransferase
MPKLYGIICCLLVFCSITSFAQEKFNWRNVRVLVYTKNGKGYVHDNIPYAVQCIQQLSTKHGFMVDTSSDASVMTEQKLKRYKLVVFTSTNNDVFDSDAQRLAFRRYFEAGGGFVGIHSVTGTERNWKWFKMMLGGSFAWHANFQQYTIKVIDASHPSMQGLPLSWQKADECYFAKELYPGPRAILAHDITSLDTSNAEEHKKIKMHAGGYVELYPAAWLHDYDGGVTWCTTLGHDKKDYSDPVFTRHIYQGIRYVAAKVKNIDFKKAYAISKDDAVRY